MIWENNLVIKIKKEILEQIQRSAEEDPRYIVKVVKRISPQIKEVIQYLSTLELSLRDICTIFCGHCRNGLDNYSVMMMKKGTVDEFFKEIEETNESLADLITICDFSQASKMVSLIILYRIFESELEIRSL